MADKIFVNGLFIKQGRFGLAVSIKVDDFISFLQEHRDGDWLRLDINEKRNTGEGKWTHYAVLNTWKPEGR